MKCHLCKHHFFVKRTINNLFTIYDYILCDKCYSLYPITLNSFIIPLDNDFMLTVLPLFEGKNTFNYLVFMKEYSKIYEKIGKLTNDLILLDEILVIGDKLIDFLSILANKLGKSILILCYLVQN